MSHSGRKGIFPERLFEEPAVADIQSSTEKFEQIRPFHQERFGQSGKALRKP